MLTYAIACINTNAGLRYTVVLRNGSAEYRGQRTYARYQDAERAAKSTGVPVREAAK